MGSTGDPPVPSGDPPLGREKSRNFAAVPAYQKRRPVCSASGLFRPGLEMRIAAPSGIELHRLDFPRKFLGNPRQTALASMKMNIASLLTLLIVPTLSSISWEGEGEETLAILRPHQKL